MKVFVYIHTYIYIYIYIYIYTHTTMLVYMCKTSNHEMTQYPI